MYSLRFKESVAKDLRRIGKGEAARVLQAVRQKLLPDPQGAGKQLKGSDGVLWSFRSGDYRVLYTMNDQELWVLVVRVGHRKEVYKHLEVL